MELKRFDNFSVGYRKGVVFTLLQLQKMLEGYKSKEDGTTAPVIIKACLDDIDIFIDYGDRCTVAFTEWDKKKHPTKSKIYPYGVEPKVRSINKLNKLVDLLEETITKQG